MFIDRLTENIKSKDFIKFHFLKFMFHLAWVANFIAIFSASYVRPFVCLPVFPSVYPTAHLSAYLSASFGPMVIKLMVIKVRYQYEYMIIYNHLQLPRAINNYIIMQYNRQSMSIQLHNNIITQLHTNQIRFKQLFRHFKKESK